MCYNNKKKDCYLKTIKKFYDVLKIKLIIKSLISKNKTLKYTPIPFLKTSFDSF